MDDEKYEDKSEEYSDKDMDLPADGDNQKDTNLSNSEND